MPGNATKDYPPRETKLVQDGDPLTDLTDAVNDADDKSDAGRPTTCHEAEGWRAISPSKP
jgi:hypothetical protein